ncbi:hypothetical protein [Subtercola lobariae]|uniref:Uncharacterized protein n=1 Tax=Subtercola lobariae TaxID=1588641 RepID=A0A917B297_9MICO|nr:hypothetical protein [Subtercola lobariae]GGF18576.1 hypothetical protein GCM10011399_10270 [Subtercola lobariae]
MSDNHNSGGPVARLWRASLLLLGSVLAVWLALQVLATIWGWLLIGALILCGIAALIFFMKRRLGGW